MLSIAGAYGWNFPPASQKTFDLVWSCIAIGQRPYHVASTVACYWSGTGYFTDLPYTLAVTNLMIPMQTFCGSHLSQDLWLDFQTFSSLKEHDWVFLKMVSPMKLPYFVLALHRSATGRESTEVMGWWCSFKQLSHKGHWSWHLWQNVSKCAKVELVRTISFCPCINHVSMETCSLCKICFLPDILGHQWWHQTRHPQVTTGKNLTWTLLVKPENTSALDTLRQDIPDDMLTSYWNQTKAQSGPLWWHWERHRTRTPEMALDKTPDQLFYDLHKSCSIFHSSTPPVCILYVQYDHKVLSTNHVFLLSTLLSNVFIM